MDLIKTFCGEVKELLKSTDSQEDIYAKGRVLVGELAQKPVFLKEIFQKYAGDDEFLLNRALPPDTNEVTLYIDPDRLFSLRLYIWEPAISYPIHGHGSWGVVSCVAGDILERKYQRLDDGVRPGYAKLREVKSAILKPGETTVVFPLDRGIHQMESVNKVSPSISLHLYGKAIRRGYLEFFDLQKDSVYRVMSPYKYGRACVLRALGAIREDWANEILAQAAAANKTPFMKYEALWALAQSDRAAALKYLESEMAEETQLDEELASLYQAIKQQAD